MEEDILRREIKSLEGKTFARREETLREHKVLEGIGEGGHSRGGGIDGCDQQKQHQINQGRATITEAHKEYTS